MALPLKKRVIVVGGGIAGLACTIKLAEEGIDVALFSLASVRRSHSVCAQGGINACNDISRQQGDSEWTHFDETILGGDFLADQPPVHEMCLWAPRIIDLLDRMGVPFNRTTESRRALRRLDGSLFHRTFYAGTTTGQQILYALDEQTRRWESEGRVQKYESWEFLWPVVHDAGGSPQCVGIVAQDLRTMQIRSFRADAVVMATGGNGMVFGLSTMSQSCTGSALARCYQAGARYANPEFIQMHPTTVRGEDKSRVISEAVRSEGARLWVAAIKENGTWKPHRAGSNPPASIPEDERYYFLEEHYPKYANLAPRDIATREIARLRDEGFDESVYLDLRDALKTTNRQKLMNKLAGTLETCEQFAGADPLVEPMKIFPAVHASMGGLWTMFKKDEKTGGLQWGDPTNMSTNIPALYAMGEVNFAYHGANRLGGNPLLSRIFDGLFGGTCVRNYCTDAEKVSAADVPQAVYDTVVRQEGDRVNWLVQNQGDENPYLLWQEVGKWMAENCTVIRDNAKLEQTLTRCQQWKDRYQRIKLSDTGMWANQNLSFARATRDMIVQAEAILRGALLRDESRGAHFKPAHPERDDVNFLKTTIATHDAVNDGPVISHEPVDTSLIPPRPRTYGRTG